MQRLFHLPWTYQAVGSRDLRLDFLRGYALLAIFINHCVFNQSLYHIVSFQGVFYAGAAQGFYFISGFVLGLISFDRTLSRVIKRILRRTLELYVAAVGLALGFLTLGYLTDLKLWYDQQLMLPERQYILTFIKNLLLLRLTFHGSEILVMYVWLMLLALLGLLLCLKRLGWLALLISIAGYIYGQLSPQVFNFPYFNYFYLPSYQLVFITGLVLGYHRKHLTEWERKTTRLMQIVKVLVVAVFVIFWLIFETHYAAWPGLPELLGDTHFMLPLRLGLVIICLYSFYLLTTWLWKPLKAAAGWLLLPLGQNSLWGFLAHYVVIVGFIYNFPGYQRYVDWSYGTFQHTILILLIWASVKIRQRLPKPGLRSLLAVSCLGVALATPYVQRWAFPYDTIDDNDPGWVWQDWQPYMDANAYEATLHGTETQGAYGEISFSGTAVDFYAVRGNDSGPLEVYLDGWYQGQINLDNGGSYDYQDKVFSISGLLKGEHELRLVSITEGWSTMDYIRIRR